MRLGEHDIRSNPDYINSRECAPKVVDAFVEKRIPHPLYDYTNKNKQRDIALLRLTRKVTFTSK